MKSRLLEELVPQVKRNCDISDSRHWGYHSICGLLLRLRELYRFERGLRPWERAPDGEITEWIGQREALWKNLAGEDFRPLVINGEEFSHFDVKSINAIIGSEGLIYGAGYGVYCKPVFFLAELSRRSEETGCIILVSGREYARDLSLYPAMLQEKTIFARKEISVLLLWEKFEEMRAKKSASALSSAFASYGIGAESSGMELERLIERAAESELLTYTHHEIGEASESEKNPLWEEMLSCVITSRASVFVRAAKDTLADTSERGMIRHIIDERKTGSLAFYAASLSGYRKLLAPGMAEAYARFSATDDWAYIESARKALYENAGRIAKRIIDLYRDKKNPDVLAEEIQREITLLQP